MQSAVKSPLFFIPVITSYLYFVLKCGPKYMEKRKPYGLRSVMLTYNALQVVGNLWLCIYVSLANYIVNMMLLYNNIKFFIAVCKNNE